MVETKPLEKMAADWAAMLPKGALPATNLMVHPLAAFAAMSAVGFGFYSQAVGAWMGAVAGAMDASRKAGSPAPMTTDEAELNAAYAETLNTETPATPDDQSGDVALVEPLVPVETAANVVRISERTARPAKRQKQAVATAEVANEGFSKPEVLEKPAQPDDLKGISGIGPKLEQMLNGLGVYTLEQIATWTESESGWVDQHLQLGGRIVRDDWKIQAAALANALNEDVKGSGSEPV